MKKLALMMVLAFAAAPFAVAQDAPPDDGTTWAQEFRAAHPNISDQELRQITALHQQHPDMDKDQIHSLWDFRKQNPGVEPADAHDMWQFHQQHPGVTRDEMDTAYRDYRADRDGFRRQHNIPAEYGDMAPEKARKVEHLKNTHPDATRQELSDHARKMDDKATKQAHTKKTAHKSAKKNGGEKPNKGGGGGGN